MGRLASLLLALLLAGCHSPVRGVEWQPIPVYSVPDPRTIVAVEPVPVLAGDVVPWDGFVIHAEDLRRLVAELRGAGDAYEALLRILALDRDEADASLRDCAELLTTCRRNQPRLFAAGVGVGAVGASAVAAGACVGGR